MPSSPKLAKVIIADELLIKSLRFRAFIDLRV